MVVRRKRCRSGSTGEQIQRSKKAKFLQSVECAVDQPNDVLVSLNSTSILIAYEQKIPRRVSNVDLRIVTEVDLRRCILAPALSKIQQVHTMRSARARVVSPQNSSICSVLDEDTGIIRKPFRDCMREPSELTIDNYSSCDNIAGRTSRKSKRLKFTTLTVMALFLSSFLFISRKAIPVEPGSVYVPGAGFSGFWFTLGRLDSIDNITSRNFYCFSAGCLGVVAALNGFSMKDMYPVALSAQNRWRSGDINRYEVVPAFVEDLLDMVTVRYNLNKNTSATFDLSRLNVLTTLKSGWFGVKQSVRTPSSLESLRILLLQTTWIPYAVGDGLWHENHNDGGFTFMYHPPCEVDLGLPRDMDLLLNLLNVNLSRTQAETFWQKGLSYSL